MAQATFSVRMDDSLKNQFESLCVDFGMNMTTAINIFAKAVVRERRIPFEISASEPEITRETAMQTFMMLRNQSLKNFPNGISLDEINAEINAARSERET
ncbi:MAG: type II toxin-antitoxin system RelB/DinJ family antitoxin [Clostridia bacterium]|nr:type II toxin-antitoxin system RelB/DinJ family antitoxin [Clostridia bacterium]